MKATNERKRIGFVQSYMTKKDKVIKTQTQEEIDGTILAFREKLAEQILYIASPKFAKLSLKTKCKKLLEYNLLVKVEAKLLSE
jgi:hypothetical protein